MPGGAPAGPCVGRFDDRRPSFEGWLDRKLEGLTDGIGQEAGAWLRTMRDGGKRRELDAALFAGGCARCQVTLVLCAGACCT